MEEKKAQEKLSSTAHKKNRTNIKLFMAEGQKKQVGNIN